MSDFGVFLLVAALGGVTLVTRSFFFMFKKELPFPTWADRGLRYAPIAALSAVIIPEIVMRHGALITDWRDGRIFGAAAEFVGAYHAVLPLLADEQEILADLVATRHLITVLITEWRSRRYPENHAYIMRHNPASWDALHLMADLSPEDARDRLLAGVRSGDGQ